MKEDKEIWKDVVGFEDYYEVSNIGRVKRKKNETIYKDGRVARFSETILKFGYSRKKYRRVYLSVKSKQYTRSIHRLVAIAFIANPENKATVNHKDLNKENNCVLNLEWMTNKENMRHAFESGVYRDRDDKNASLTDENMAYIENNYIKKTPSGDVGSASLIAKKLGISQSLIYEVASGKYRSSIFNK